MFEQRKSRIRSMISADPRPLGVIGSGKLCLRILLKSRWRSHESGVRPRPLTVESPIQAISLLLLTVLFCVGASARTIYVDASEDDDWTSSSATSNFVGTSWAMPYQYLQDALAAAGAGDEIRVAKGVYRPDQGSAVASGGRMASFQLKSSVVLKGGYAGQGAAIPDHRNTELYRSVLSGDRQGNDAYVSDPGRLLSESTRSENCYHVVKASSVNDTAVLDGFTIEGGNANFTLLQREGAGIFIQNATPTLLNCTFRYNSAAYAGGGMANDPYGYPTISNCIFVKNWGGRGGGMYSHWSSTPKLTNCVFRDNRANSGGAVYDSSSSTWLINCTLKDNAALQEGGGMCATGPNSNPVVINCILWGNTDAGGRDQSSQTHFASGVFPTLSFSCIEGWHTTGGSTNTGSDPKFEHPEGQLSPGSPCIDAGRNDIVPSGIETDLPGNARFVDDPGAPNTGQGTGPIVDMGAYEFAGGSVLPRVIYVQYGATGADTGTSWKDAYKYLQTALDFASSGDEIRVAQGVYRPDQAGLQTGWREQTFWLKSGVAMKGGYAGYGAANPDARDLHTYETVLSGDILTRGSSADNCCHVVTAVGCSALTVLDGFTITGGNANLSGGDFFVGGGMYVDGGRPRIKNCTFVDNSAKEYGGGLFIWNSSAEVSDCTFSNNFAGPAGYGGGMHCESCTVTVTGCTFTENSTGWGFGGGMATGRGNVLGSVIDCRFDRNSAGHGGGIYNTSNMRVADCDFNGNWTEPGEEICGGGGMWNSDCRPQVVNCIFNGNRTGGLYGGGGICNDQKADPWISNCLFYNNKATRTRLNLPVHGGGMSNYASQLEQYPRIINCTFKNNSAEGKGGAIYNSSPCYATVANCILWNNSDGNGSGESAQLHNDNGGRAAVSYCCIQGWSGSLGGTANFGTDPRFSDTEGRLSAGSPCINSGDNNWASTVSRDLDGNPRILNDVVDRGAYEYGGGVTPPQAGIDLCDAGEEYRSFSPRTFQAGQSGQIIELHFAIHNKGTVDAPSHGIRFYLSANTQITTSDYFIVGGTLWPLPAGEIQGWQDSDAPFPTNVPPGRYYLGWIIDWDNEIPETDESNNTAYVEKYQLVVN